MLVLGPIGFALPWLLWGLLALPVLWLLLRAVPPAPVIRRFPGVALLLGLTDRDTEAERTPWWLMLLRMLAIAALIVGFAGPVLNPEPKGEGKGPLLIVVDGTWADARDWPRRVERIARALDDAARAGRPVALVSLTDLPAGPPAFTEAHDVAENLPGLRPRPWEPTAGATDAFASTLPARFNTLWLSDGLARDGRASLLAALQSRGDVRVFETGRPAIALAPAAFADGMVSVPVLRAVSAGPLAVEVVANGLDPSGTEQELARVPVTLAPGAASAKAGFDLPPELRNRLTRFEIAGERSAGAVSLTDDALKRRKVAVIDTTAGAEGLELLSPAHYLRQALAPNADLITGTIHDVLLASPDVIILADIAKVAETDALLDWIDEGGLLVRFAGPHLAASDALRDGTDPLLPVRLRAGGRSVGGTLSWGEAKAIAPFPESSPFHGLAVPADVSVRAQVLAQPDPELATATIAALADGTPLVTQKRVGDGRIVLFHTAANAEWSSLPLSGLFVQMLERLAVSSRAARPEPADLTGTTWVADRVLDAFGVLGEAGDLPGIAGETLAAALPGPDLPPGLYSDGDRRLAVNAVAEGRVLAAPDWPASVTVEGLAQSHETNLKGWVLLAALAFLLADILAALSIGGRLGRRAGAAMAVIFLALAALPQPGHAQDGNDDGRLLTAANNVVLGYIETGDPQVDDISRAGIKGLSDTLFLRTTVEPVAPTSVDPETDELSLYTLIYWPVTADQPLPSPAAYVKLNRYLRSGGMVLFDTRDGDMAGFGSATPEGRRLQALAAPLDIPPLAPIPPDHVLTRTFYLLQDFPGRFSGQPVWAEAPPEDAERAEGMPFRNLNDGVSPVVIGGNDWASAWAVDKLGRPLLPVGRGETGERQREIARRFGVNLVMYVLTGNYKSDQVHVPALLERLGQ